uniref:Secreted protein n=1 Tax=Caenorhabditis tropicalis TaxID=1561998 RepID=A0A1I7TR99_9PELO
MGQLFLFSLCILAGCLSAGPLPSRETYGLTYGCDICRIFGGCPRRAFSSSDRDDGYYPEQLKHGDLTRVFMPPEDNDPHKPQYSKSTLSELTPIANQPASNPHFVVKSWDHRLQKKTKKKLGSSPPEKNQVNSARASKNDIPLEDNENTKPQFSKIANNPPSKVNNGGLTRGLTISG